MTLSEANRIGIQSGLYPGFTHMTIEQACTQTCDDCGKVIEVHPDARWRFSAHVIRCVACQDAAIAGGASLTDALFVV